MVVKQLWNSVDKKKFSLHHHIRDDFHRSEWVDPGQTSRLYLAYRVTVAVLFVAGILWHALHTRDTLGAKWLIYMTNQGITVLTVHYVLYAGIVVARHWLNAAHISFGSLPALYRISWCLHNTSISVALFISVIYWAFLHPWVIEYHLMSSTLDQFLNVFLHGLNSVSCLIDIMITARPIRVQHCYLPMLFGIYYTAFSLIYWAAGGKGRCGVRCYEVANSTSSAGVSTTLAGEDDVTNMSSIDISITALTSTSAKSENTCGEEVCDAFIYPILDWQDHPGPALGLIAAGLVVIPLFHTFWWLLYRFRTYLSRRFGGRRFEVGSPEKKNPQNL